MVPNIIRTFNLGLVSFTNLMREGQLDVYTAINIPVVFEHDVEYQADY